MLFNEIIDWKTSTKFICWRPSSTYAAFKYASISETLNNSRFVLFSIDLIHFAPAEYTTLYWISQYLLFTDTNWTASLPASLCTRVCVTPEAPPLSSSYWFLSHATVLKWPRQLRSNRLSCRFRLTWLDMDRVYSWIMLRTCRLEKNITSYIFFSPCKIILEGFGNVLG